MPYGVATRSCSLRPRAIDSLRASPQYVEVINHNREKNKMEKTNKTGEQRTVAPLLIDMDGVCQCADIDRSTGWRWLKLGILPKPAVKVGRVVRWNIATIEKWASEGVRA